MPTPETRNTQPPADYVGRFAPSPTGPLHFGSLITALASYLDARAHGGRWLLRIEDIDPPREQLGASAAILASLQRHGLKWDGEVLYQSRRFSRYREAADRLVAEDRAFYCSCSRAQLARHACHCRDQFAPPAGAAAIRLQVDAGECCFDDRLQGRYCEAVDDVAGDFVIFRKEQLPAYQLAVVIDDAAQGVTDVVRGCDLLDNTARQILLQRALRLPELRYLHVPVIANRQGQKLSKQTHAQALRDDQAIDNLRAALNFLGQPPLPAAIRQVHDLLAAAVAGWTADVIPRARRLSADELPPSCRSFAH